MKTLKGRFATELLLAKRGSPLFLGGSLKHAKARTGKKAWSQSHRLCKDVCLCAVCSELPRSRRWGVGWVWVCKGGQRSSATRFVASSINPASPDDTLVPSPSLPCPSCQRADGLECTAAEAEHTEERMRALVANEGLEMAMAMVMVMVMVMGWAVEDDGGSMEVESRRSSEWEAGSLVCDSLGEVRRRSPGRATVTSTGNSSSSSGSSSGSGSGSSSSSSSGRSSSRSLRIERGPAVFLAPVVSGAQSSTSWNEGMTQNSENAIRVFLFHLTCAWTDTLDLFPRTCIHVVIGYGHDALKRQNRIRGSNIPAGQWCAASPDPRYFDRLAYKRCVSDCFGRIFAELRHASPPWLPTLQPLVCTGALIVQVKAHPYEHLPPATCP
ncbi:predicted protein [Verticillium alfalfae VaMs.102]|uniref:Predicted protein n=1 Tax=Verticillium alfalfae (strain VaMs.102 / ATCC MYA-4576 / FGSC 10136) TaxID=526221 RepID=C9SRD5_VERA1|nr:predicted protein [Verticillium alfalfae VaMs.102]EEY21350.1 predicted protein [Verticillium alfalfae VaMs.102]